MLTTKPKISFIVRFIGLFIVYFVTAKIGLSLHVAHNFATLIWAPTGIALASLTIFDLDLWPAVTLAALLVNWSIGTPPIVTIGIAVGNTLEAVVGAKLLRYYAFDPSFGKIRDVLLLVFIGAIFSTFFSATIGVGALWFAGVVTGGTIKTTWVAWWTGNISSDLIVAPFLMIWYTLGFKFKSRPQLVGGALDFLLVIIICIIVFSLSGLSALSAIRPSMIIPIFLLFALFCEQRCTLSAVLAFSIAALFVTGHGWGPLAFQSISINHNFLLVQSYFCALAVGNLVVSTVLRERRDYGHSLEQINLRLAKAEREIREKNEQLLTAHKAKDGFISNLSHELRNPLNIITGYSQMLKSLSPNGDQFKLAVSAIERSASTQLHLVDDLLDMSRIVTGKFSINAKSCDFRELVDNAYKAVEYSANAKGVALKVDVEIDNPIIVCDGVRMQQVLWNLLSNAVKFTNKGGFVLLTVRRNASNFIIEVKDDGIGISASDLPHIFERLWQVAGPTKTSKGGLGLGLSIVKDLVEGHGGTVEAESAGVGKGSTFRIKIPIQTI